MYVERWRLQYEVDVFGIAKNKLTTADSIWGIVIGFKLILKHFLENKLF